MYYICVLLRHKVATAGTVAEESSASVAAIATLFTGGVQTTDGQVVPSDSSRRIPN